MTSIFIFALCFGIILRLSKYTIKHRYPIHLLWKAVFLKNNPDIRNDSLFAYLKVLAYRLPSDKLRDEFKTEIIDLVGRYKSFLDIALIDFPCEYEKKL